MPLGCRGQVFHSLGRLSAFFFFFYKLDCSIIKATTLLDIFLLVVNFDKNPLLNYIFFLYPPCLQTVQKIKNQ